jgi:cell division protein FtsI (penicillin-binding protein 3)
MNRVDLLRDAQAQAEEAERAARPWRETLRRRLAWLLIGCAAWGLTIAGRLVYLQVIRHQHYVAFVAQQQADTEVLPGLRGRIVDRQGEVLAVTVQRDRVIASPKLLHETVPDDGIDGLATRVCAAIEACDEDGRQRILRAFTDRPGSQYAMVWRDMSPADTQHIEALGQKGLFIQSEGRRFYPSRDLAAHVVGHVDNNQRGLTGVEKSHDSDIRGRNGLRRISKDGLSRGFDSTDKPATIGASLELTIDRPVQLITEEALAWGVREYNAKGGVAIVADPATGEILASASYPSYNPNRFTAETIGHDRDRASQDIYEPGSTFKLITASTALDTGLLTPDSPIDVAGGAIRIGKHVIRDVHAYGGSLSLRDVVVKSSNVGAIRVGRAAGAQRLAEFSRAFGFGWLTARDLPFPSRGALLKPTDRWSEASLASVSMGYQVGVTPIQLVAAVSAIANGGVLYEPYVVRAVIQGAERRPRAPKPLHRVLSPQTAAVMTSIMEGVVEVGTAKAARIDGFTIAGKTGTAKKAAVGRRGYTGDYNASFVGFAPSRNPAFTVLVVIDSPKGKGFYGGAVAAPVFRRIAEATLRHRGIAPNVDSAGVQRVLVARRPSEPTPGVVVQPVSHPAPALALSEIVAGTMPDLRGLSARDAVRTLTGLGVLVRLRGHGVVVAQDVEPATPIAPGSGCTLTLGRRPPDVVEASSQP